jgi:hypothetical protein
MKTVKPVGVFESVRFYAAIVGNILILYLYVESPESKFPFSYAMVTFLVMNVVFYFVGVSDHYQFEYDDKQLIVTNAWNPLFYQMYYIKSLERVEFDYFNNVGRGIRIFQEGSKDVFVCASFDDRLKDMAEDINSLIKASKGGVNLTHI